MRKIGASELKLNMMFSAPVFFEDGKYMFLAEGKSIKPYHLEALKKWNIQYVLTDGNIEEQGEGSNIERMAGFDKKRLNRADAGLEPVKSEETGVTLEELEEI